MARIDALDGLIQADTFRRALMDARWQEYRRDRLIWLSDRRTLAAVRVLRGFEKYWFLLERPPANSKLI